MLLVRVHDEDDGTLWAEVLDYPGCFASGRDMDELAEGLDDAIALYLDDGSAFLRSLGRS